MGGLARDDSLPLDVTVRATILDPLSSRLSPGAASGRPGVSCSLRGLLMLLCAEQGASRYRNTCTVHRSIVKRYGNYLKFPEEVPTSTVTQRSMRIVSALCRAAQSGRAHVRPTSSVYTSS